MDSGLSFQENLDKQFDSPFYIPSIVCTYLTYHTIYRLLHACRYGRVQEVDLLLSKNANIHYTDENDPFCASSLSEACRTGNADIVKLLLKKGAKPTDKISHDITPLHIACERGHLNVVQVLLSSFMSTVVNNNNEEEEKDVKSAATDITSNLDIDHMKDENTNNILNIIVQSISPLTSNLACAQELFNLDTPLHFAAANNHSDICKILINKGNADINVQNRTGDTPLHCAVVNDRAKTTRMLLELGADITIKNHAEMTPIVVAQMAKCQKTFDILQAYVYAMQEKNIQLQTKKATIYEEMTDIKVNECKENKPSYTTIFDSLATKKTVNEESVFASKRNMSYKKGWLKKQGKNFKTYHDRYFILYANGLMKYFTKEHTKFASFKKRKSSLKNLLFNDNDTENEDDERQMNLLLDRHPSANKKQKSDQISLAILRDDNILPPVMDACASFNSNSSSNSSDSGGVPVTKNDNSPHLVFKSYSSSSYSSTAAVKVDYEINDINKVNDEIKSNPETKVKKVKRIKRWGSSHRIQPRRKKSTLSKIFHGKSNSYMGNYSSNKPINTQKGVIDLNDFIETQFLQFEDNTIGFAIITNEREWKFKCETDVERREWIASVHAVIIGISRFDLPNLGMHISYENGTMLMKPSTDSFLFDGKSANTVIAAGWMFKMGVAVSGLEKSYWKKRWVSLYDKPGKLTYAEHPYCEHNIGNEQSEEQKIDDKNNVPIESDQNVSYTTTLKDDQSPTKLMVKKQLRKKWSIGSSVAANANGLKGSILLSDVNLIVKIKDSELIRHKYRSPTVHVFAMITNKRTWVFACKTDEECSLWYERIKFFIPNQWKQNAHDLNLEELLKYHRMESVANLNQFFSENDDGNKNESKIDDRRQKLNVNQQNKNQVFSKILRKISHLSESIGIIEPYSSISSVQPRGTITTYNDINRMVQSSDQYLLNSDGDDSTIADDKC